MNSLPRQIGLLGAIVAFCAAMLVGLLRDCPPLQTGRRALIGAVLAGIVVQLAVQLALGVLREGLRQYERERTESP